MLHEVGYEIRKGWCPVTSELLTSMAAIKTAPIFNDNPTYKTDRKRKQATISTPWSRAVRHHLRTEFPTLRPSSMVMIESEPGCQRQAAHCDYIPTEELLSLPDEEMPLLFLLAVEANTMLDIWPGSHLALRGATKKRCRRKTLVLDAGDAVLFRADVIHAGSAYVSSNRRFHVYLDNPEHHRDPNRTWIIYKHASAGLRAQIDEYEDEV